MAAKLIAVVILGLTAEVAASGLSKSTTPFAENLFGTWHRKAGEVGKSAKAILGPLSYYMLPSMYVLRDPATNDVWFTLLQGQKFRVSGNQTQYCFGPETLVEQSPFSVQSVTESSVNFCWRNGLRGMPTHAKGCSGCECARILLNLTDPDSLRFQFWMSPPVIHADVEFVRFGKAPSFFTAITTSMPFPYQQCAMRDHYGPNLPIDPILTTTPPSASEALNAAPARAGGCAEAVSKVALTHMKNDDFVAEASGPQCYQLNGINFKLDKLVRWAPLGLYMGVRDVQVQFATPAGPCDPCDVSYAVSALIADDEYISVGFKGRSWESDLSRQRERESRPCYFGMCIDEYDNRTSDRIALGYTAGGGCVREMIAKDIVGAPSDAANKILKDTSVTRAYGRTILRFTISQHWGFVSRFVFDGPWRIMWAIGKVSPSAEQDGCTAGIGYHDNHRGVAPLQWLRIGSTNCTVFESEAEKGHEFLTIV